VAPSAVQVVNATLPDAGNAEQRCPIPFAAGQGWTQGERLCSRFQPKVARSLAGVVRLSRTSSRRAGGGKGMTWNGWPRDRLAMDG
jgi:hypothetical protein